MEITERFRHYLNSITEAFLEDDEPDLHLMAQDAIIDYARDNITYKQLYVIKSLVAIFTLAGTYDK